MVHRCQWRRWTRLALGAGLAALGAGSGPVWASSVSDELVLDKTHATATNPDSTALSDAIGGSFDITPALVNDDKLTYTRDFASPPATGTHFPEGGGNIYLLTSGLSLEYLDHLTSGLKVSFSPPSVQDSDAPAELEPKGSTHPMLYDTDIRTNAWSLGGELDLGFDTAGEDDDDLAPPPSFETIVTFTAGVTAYASTQQAIEVVGPAGREFTTQEILADCEAADAAKAQGKKTVESVDESTECRRLVNIIKRTDSSVSEFPFTLNVDQVLFDRFDVGANGAWYTYSSNPDDAGLFTITRLGRTASGGNGVFTDPYLWSAGVMAGYRFFDALTVDLTGAYAEFYADQGFSDQVGVKLKWRINGTWKVWASATLYHDVEYGDPSVADSNQVTNSTMWTAGARYAF